MVQNVIAMVYDCDLTLSPHYMQDPLFKRFGVDSRKFWTDKDVWADNLRADGISVQQDTIYLDYLLENIGPDKMFNGLTRQVLREEGANIKFYPGIPEFFPAIKEFVESNEAYSRYGITVEHYVASTGIREMLLGSAIAPHITSVEMRDKAGHVMKNDGKIVKMVCVDACDFRYDENGVPKSVVFHMTHTQKTAVLFDINKGIYQDPKIDINAFVPESKRRVPFKNMMYFGDGPSDVPCMSVLKKARGDKMDGGFNFAVFNQNPANPDYAKDPAVNAMKLRLQDRADFIAGADYRVGSTLYQLVQSALKIMADRIVREMELDLKGSIRAPPGHKE